MVVLALCGLLVSTIYVILFFLGLLKGCITKHILKTVDLRCYFLKYLVLCNANKISNFCGQ